MYGFLLAVVIIPILQGEIAVSSSVSQEAWRTTELLYNMTFDTALASARSMVTMAPEHPAGYFYEAATYWQWRLIIRDAPQRATFLRRFSERIKTAIDVAKRWLPEHESEAAFYLGAAYGMQARMYVAEQRYLKALSSAKQGGAYLR